MTNTNFKIQNPKSIPNVSIPDVQALIIYIQRRFNDIKAQQTDDFLKPCIEFGKNMATLFLGEVQLHVDMLMDKECGDESA